MMVVSHVLLLLGLLSLPLVEDGAKGIELTKKSIPDFVVLLRRICTASR